MGSPNDYWILLFLSGCMVWFLAQRPRSHTEGFQDKQFIDDEAWDSFYADVWDELFSHQDRLILEQQVFRKHSANELQRSLRFLDIGSGTGFHAALFPPPTYLGVDRSRAMVDKASRDNPSYIFQVGDVMDRTLFAPKQFSHISCTYFTFYQFENQNVVLENIQSWLRPGGIFFLHLVDPELFDPVLDAASPFPAFSLQKYSKERVVESTVVFDQFEYTSEFQKKPHEDRALFYEKFEFKDKSTREHINQLNMPSIKSIEAKLRLQWKLRERVDMTPAGYEYHFIYVLESRI